MKQFNEKLLSYQASMLRAKEKYLAIAEKPLDEENAKRINGLNPIERMLLLQFGLTFKKIYQFPTECMEKGARVILYGAGDVGKDYYEYIKERYVKR